MADDDLQSENEATARGNRIRDLRLNAGWGQKKLAEKAGVSQSQISDWENGAPIGSSSLTTFAKVFGTTVRFLRTGEDSIINTLLQKDIAPHEYFNDLRGATQLWMTGLNLRRIFPDEVSIIEDVCAKEAGRIKAVVLDPDYDEGSRYGAIQEYGDERQAKRYKATIELAIEELSRLKGSKLELKCIKYPLSFGLDIINAENPPGFLYVRFYPLRRRLLAMPQGAGEDRFETCPDAPVVKLEETNPDHRYWYDFYKKQFYTIWSLAADWSP